MPTHLAGCLLRMGMDMCVFRNVYLFILQFLGAEHIFRSWL